MNKSNLTGSQIYKYRSINQLTMKDNLYRIDHNWRYICNARCFILVKEVENGY